MVVVLRTSGNFLSAGADLLNRCADLLRRGCHFFRHGRQGDGAYPYLLNDGLLLVNHRIEGLTQLLKLIVRADGGMYSQIAFSRKRHGFLQLDNRIHNVPGSEEIGRQQSD
ncbi:hypothetical protein D3C75_959630 [compost metagenome]